MGSHCSFGHLKHKLWPKERSGVKLPIWLPTRKSQESTRFTWLQRACDIPLERSRRKLQLCFRPHLDPRSTRKVIGLQSCKSPNLGDFGTPTWESRDKKPFGWGPRGEVQGEPLAGREATAPSIIRKIEKVQGGEQAPRNGSLALPKDAAVKPFSLKGKLNAILIVLSPILARRSNGLPGGHAHLRRSFPRLEQNPFEGVLAIEVPSASFEPKIIKQKAPKNVEGLSPVGEATRVVAMEVRGVVLFFEHGLPKKNEGPGNGEAVGRLPLTPDTKENTPGLLGRGAFHEAVSGRFLEPLVAAFAGGLNSHGLEPGAHRQLIVEGQPDERANLAGTRIVPHSGNDLGNYRVV